MLSSRATKITLFLLLENLGWRMWLLAGGITSPAFGLSTTDFRGIPVPVLLHFPCGWITDRGKTHTAPPQHQPFPSVSFSDGTLCILAGSPAALDVVVLHDSGVLSRSPSARHHPHWSGTSLREQQKRGCQKQPRNSFCSTGDTSSQTLIIPMFAFFPLFLFT